MATPLRIGLSARLLYPDSARCVLPTKYVLYAEESAVNWLIAGGAVAFVIPRITDATVQLPSAAHLTEYVDALDGLVLQGGSDVAPSNYAEEPLRPAWAGDPERDRYEIELLREFLRQKKPVLGICRGCQLINVALGGSLYQDLATQGTNSSHHRHESLYDGNHHDAMLLPNSQLAATYGGPRRVKVNSIHHQAIKSLGNGLVVEAMSVPDRIVEAVRWNGASYLVGVQWHPEFTGREDDGLLDSDPLRQEFFAACHAVRNRAAGLKTEVRRS